MTLVSKPKILIEDPDTAIEPIKGKKLSIRISEEEIQALKKYKVKLSPLVRNLLRQYIALKEANDAKKK